MHQRGGDTQMQHFGMRAQLKKTGEGWQLRFYRLLETIRKELCYHSRGFRTTFEIGRDREPGAAFKCLPVAIVFSFADRFALRANDDDGFCGLPSRAIFSRQS